MAVPTLTFKVWTGASNEYWTYRDMNRVEYNANVLAGLLSVATVSYAEVTRASIFDYTEFQKLENEIAAVAAAAGTAYTPETAWAAGRSFSYVDCERVEYGLYLAYKALGGQGDRVPSDKVVTVARLTLRADGWSGSYPYQQTFVVFGLDAATTGILIPGIPTTVAQKVQMDDARLTIAVGDRSLTVTALGRRPTIDLGVIIITEVLSMETQTTLSGSGWSGSGPFTQNVSVSGLKTTYPGAAGIDQRATAAQVDAFVSGRIYLSAIPSDGTATITAVGVKPTVAIPISIHWDDLTGGDE